MLSHTRNRQSRWIKVATAPMAKAKPNSVSGSVSDSVRQSVCSRRKMVCFECALRNVLKCSTRHTPYTIRFGHFNSAALITKNAKNCVCAFNPVGVATGTRSSAAANEKCYDHNN